MRDLLIYVDPLSARGGSATFYSRRSGGPVYRWLYEEVAGRWRFSRVHLSKFDLSVFCVMKAESIPTSLRARLREHYVE